MSCVEYVVTVAMNNKKATKHNTRLFYGQTMQEAVDKYKQWKWQSGIGSSAFSYWNATLRESNGTLIAYMSFNGRLWEDSNMTKPKQFELV
jgi:hypothetical protein